MCCTCMCGDMQCGLMVGGRGGERGRGKFRHQSPKKFRSFKSIHPFPSSFPSGAATAGVQLQGGAASRLQRHCCNFAKLSLYLQIVTLSRGFLFLVIYGLGVAKTVTVASLTVASPDCHCKRETLYSYL